MAVVAQRPWVRFYDEGVPHTVDYPSAPLHTFLDDSARKHPNATCTIFFNAKLTYREVSDLADRFAAGLQAAGVKKGDRVALMLPNSPQFVISFFGALRAGAIVVPINPLYTPPEVQRTLADSGAVALVVLSRMYPTATQAAAGSALRTIVVTSIKEYMPAVLRTLFTLAKEKKEGHRQDLSGDPRARWFQDFLAEPGKKPTPVVVQPEDTAALLYTGGTTGVPKGAVLSHRAMVSNACMSRAWYRDTGEVRPIAMAVMPFFHSYGLSCVMNTTVVTGGSMILMPRFELTDVLKAIQRHKPQQFAGTPRIYIAINNSPLAGRYDLRSIQACLSGAAALPVDVAQKFEEITQGGKLVEGYGLTEAGPVSHANPLYGRRKVGSVGVPFPNVDSKIVDLETGTRELGVGEVGEVIIRSPSLMDGYYRRPDETALVLRDGWLYTGDIGRMDEDGYFYIVDRKKEMIIVSGFNVYPREVEEVLYTHRAVLEAAVISVPHPERGEAVKAFVVLKPGASATGEELIEHCRGSLARYKVPIEIEFRPELPKTLIGKVLRRQLAEEEKAKRSQKAR